VRRVCFWSVLVCAALAAGPAWACSVPVFRYALERWPVAPYEVYVFHRGSLAAEHQKALARLKAADAYVTLADVDVAGKMDEDTAKIWQGHSAAALPWMVVRYPSDLHAPVDAWAGPLAEENVALLLDSPARRQVARRILEGDCAVFLLLEGGDRAKDDATAILLETELKRLQETLELPKPENGNWGDPVYDERGAPQLHVAFSSIRVSRTDPAERIFVKLLTATMPALDHAAMPIAFPMFGRGRVLDALIGPQIDKDVIEDACAFLIGPCSCIAKSQNPGIDMVMAVDWEAALSGQKSAIPKVDAPPLTGTGAFASAGAEGGGPPATRAAVLKYLAIGVAAGVTILAVAGVLVWRKTRSTSTD